MGVEALAGLYAMLIGGMFLAAMVAVCEFAWRKRKLAVDENVSCLLPLCWQAYMSNDIPRS